MLRKSIWVARVASVELLKCDFPFSYCAGKDFLCNISTILNNACIIIATTGKNCALYYH